MVRVFTSFIPFSFIYCQDISSELIHLGKKINTLTYSNKYDSAQSLVISFLDKKDLNKLETFYGHFYFGDVLKSSGKPGEAIKYLKRCKKYLNGLPKKFQYESLVYGKLAECYFDFMDFENAGKYAKQSLNLYPDSSLRSGGHAVNYSMLGYCDYLRKDYSSSLSFYELALKEYRKYGEYCELPLCYMKMAKVFSASGKKILAENYLKNALSLSDSCEIKNYKLLTLYTILDLKKEEKKYQEGLATLEEINALVEEIGFEKQDRLMDELEVQYETRLAQKENENLKELNSKNVEILLQQKTALFIAAFALLILSVLISLLIKKSAQKRKALRELRDNNTQIEKQNLALERLHRLNQKIFSVISHDFRGPIISLQLLLKALHEQTLDAQKISHYTSDLSQQLNQTKNIIENLLNWARTEMNPASTEGAVSSPRQIASEIIGQQKNEVDKKGLRVTNNIPENILLRIPPDILRIVFRNLISNAVKYSFENSEIVLDYDPRSNSLLIKDSGIGIEPPKQIQLFSHNIESSLGTHKENGFGFGLYITHELLCRFKGNISVYSAPEKGTVFKVSIPEISSN